MCIRDSLQPIISGLKAQGISYSAQDLDSLGDSPVIADLLTLCRALANDADRLAWMALLRAPWCGLRLADLLLIARHGDTPRYTPLWGALCSPALLDSLSPDGRERINHILPALQRARQQRDRLGLRVWIEQAWWGLGGPECAAESAWLQDAESFFQLLEQAEVEGVGLDPQWLQKQLQKRFMSGGDPASKLQLMTLHKAKGLEFDRVIIPQLAKLPRGDGRELLLWDEHSSPDGERNFLLAADDHSAPGEPTLYTYLHQQRKQKSLLEGTRLLYVGATRAVRHLLLTASLQWDEKKEVFREPSSRSLLHPIWTTFAAQMIVHQPPAEPAVIVSRNLPGSLARLQRKTRATVLQAGDTGSFTGDRNIPVRAGNYTDRCIGTTVHLALEELSRRRSLPAAIDDTDRRRWRMALQRNGLAGTPLQEALQAVADSVTQSLQAGGTGRWVLCPDHKEAHSEWSLTSVDGEGRLQKLVIDRSFVDRDTGERWLVDYKNSRPADGEGLAEFTARETDTYHEQLLRYRDALRCLGPQPLRCALFFTALGHLHRLQDLDLPGRTD